MNDFVKRYRIADSRKIVHSHNRVTVYPQAPTPPVAPVILFLNSFKEWRHPELVIDAFDIVRKEVPTASAILVGYRPSDTPVVEKVRARVKALALEDSVRIEPVGDPFAFYAIAAVFLYPAGIVYCNCSLLEAMERGIPPVVGAGLGAEKIVEHGKNGYIVPSNGKALAEGVLAVLRDPEKRERLGMAARAKVIAEFNETDRVQQLLQIYRDRVWKHGVISRPAPLA